VCETKSGQGTVHDRGARSSETITAADNWLSRLKVWRQNLLATPFALITAGLTVWLNLAVPLADPKLFS
jgi:hypothetical protein